MRRSWRQCSAPAPSRLSAGHRREKSDLGGPLDWLPSLHVGAVDGGADHLGVLEGVGVVLAARTKPRHQFADRDHSGRNLDVFLRLADALAHPGKIAQFNRHQSIIYLSPARI